ncbi:hypothetical protein, partial [Bacteroides pyogenes]|uniref:hypothetical protein n=1 Tax=Bacteroides pyogenes TaxID=310300 RepID=UPI00242E4EA1
VGAKHIAANATANDAKNFFIVFYFFLFIKFRKTLYLPSFAAQGNHKIAYSQIFRHKNPIAVTPNF